MRIRRFLYCFLLYFAGFSCATALVNWKVDGDAYIHIITIFFSVYFFIVSYDKLKE